MMCFLIRVVLLVAVIPKCHSLVLDVQSEYIVDEISVGDTASYLMKTTITKTTPLKFHVKLPFSTTSLFTVISMELIHTGSSLALQQPLPKFVAKSKNRGTGNNQAEWALGTVMFDNQESTPGDHDLTIRVTIQAQDHPLLIEGGVHWLSFAVEYTTDKQYLVQKQITVRRDLNRFVSLNLNMSSSFESVFTIGQTMSFDMEISHRFYSRAACKDIKLFLHSQPYMSLLTINERNGLNNMFELSNTRRLVTIKIPRLELHQTLSFMVSMSVGLLVLNDTTARPVTNSLTAELVYKKKSEQQCQEEIQNTYEVQALDYQVQPMTKEMYSEPAREMPLLEFLNPRIRCSSCGFPWCCLLSSVKLSSSSFWLPFPVEDKLQYLEFDFHTVVLLKRISLKGSGAPTNAYVKTFRLLFSSDGVRWTTQIYNGKKQIYDGNVDPSTEVVQRLKPLTNARHVRIVPLTWHKRAAIRVEFWSDKIEAFQLFGPKGQRCIGNNGNNSSVYLLSCNQSDVYSQRWLWTDYEQLRHVKTGKCLEGHCEKNDETNTVSLQTCNSTLISQKWLCQEGDFIISKECNKAIHLLPSNTVQMSSTGSNISEKIIKIYTNTSICSEKGDPPFARRQMLLHRASGNFIVCDLNSKSETTTSHCLFTNDGGNTWQVIYQRVIAKKVVCLVDLDVQLFNVLGIGEPRILYGLSPGQKAVIKLVHYNFVIATGMLKSEWENIKKESSNLDFPVDIPFIPFGENFPHSEKPTNELTIQSSAGVPQWGASSAGIHSFVDDKWKLVLSWSKLGTLYARPCSCKQILEFGQSNGDGVYTIYPSYPLNGVKAYCDMTRDGGGWTLLITSKTPGWSMAKLLSHAAEEPSISKDHSILGKANQIRYQTEENCFQYRIEAQSFSSYGGIWRAPKSYSFVATNNSQINVALLKKFGQWNYNDSSIEKRMPWICEKNCNALLTPALYPCSMDR